MGWERLSVSGGLPKLWSLELKTNPYRKVLIQATGCRLKETVYGPM
jgi:hypothetical protein